VAGGVRTPAMLGKGNGRKWKRKVREYWSGNLGGNKIYNKNIFILV
jgi:hypothetical protein